MDLIIFFYDSEIYLRNFEKLMKSLEFWLRFFWVRDSTLIFLFLE